MRKRIRRVLTFALAAMMLIAMPCAKVLAAEEIETVSPDVVEMETVIIDVGSSTGITLFATIITKDVGVSFSSTRASISIATTANWIASVIGVKDIKFQKQVWYGWNTVATSAGGEFYNVSGMTCQCYYDNPENGATYRVTCTHYANVDGYKEAYTETSGYLCKF